MKLSVTDRLLLIGLLPEQGNIVTLRVLRETRQKLELSAEELERWEVVPIGGGVRWNNEKAEEVEIFLSEAALGIVRERMQAMDREQKLTAAHIPLWEKVVESKP